MLPRLKIDTHYYDDAMRRAAEAFGEELENALKDKYPRIYELIESRKAALEEAAPEK